MPIVEFEQCTTLVPPRKRGEETPMQLNIQFHWKCKSKVSILCPIEMVKILSSYKKKKWSFLSHIKILTIENYASFLDHRQLNNQLCKPKVYFLCPIEMVETLRSYKKKKWSFLSQMKFITIENYPSFFWYSQLNNQFH